MHGAWVWTTGNTAVTFLPGTSNATEQPQLRRWRRPGRKPGVVLSVRLDHDEAVAVRAAAERAGAYVSSWAREVLIRAARA